MKKVLLTGAALMAFAASGFAQNTSTVNQNGTGQTANATQVGNQQTSENLSNASKWLRAGKGSLARL